MTISGHVFSGKHSSFVVWVSQRTEQGRERSAVKMEEGTRTQGTHGKRMWRDTRVAGMIDFNANLRKGLGNVSCLSRDNPWDVYWKRAEKRSKMYFAPMKTVDE